MMKNKLKKCLPIIISACLFAKPVILPQLAVAQVSVTDFSDLVEQVAPSVARVNVMKKLSNEQIAQIQTALLLRRYLGANVPDNLPPAVENSFGTAFFVSTDGYMLTNYHVVAGADNITVTLNDRRELDAKLIGSDERTDMAVLKVVGTDFPALPIGNSDILKVGEPVLAIGSPFGFDYSASSGIVSAKSRNFSRDTVVPFIQTDVALNPGNSGGPLFNQKGEVVGVNSRIFTGTGGYMGLSFSIPIDVAMDVYEQIRNQGSVSRAYFGVFSQDIDRNLADAYGLAKPVGALLTRVSPNSPAQKAGLKSGDVVLALNGKMIETSDDLTNLVNRAKPNDSFTVKIQRNQQFLTLQGVFQKAPNDTTSDTVQSAENNPVKLGLRLRTLTAEEQQALGMAGVIITAIDPFGLASSSGLQAGDIVLQLNNKTVETAQDFAKVVQSLPKKGVITIQLIRQGVPMIIGLRIE